MVNVSVDAPEWKIWKLSWDTRFLCPQMESIFPKRVFSSQSNLPDWCCFMFDKSKPFKFNARIKTEACNCMNNFSLHQNLFEQAFEKKEKKTTKKWMGNCIYWRPQYWRLVVNSEVVNPDCINYIYWRPYLVWFIFVRLRSGDWFGAQNSGADRNWGFCLATYLVSEILTLSLLISFTDSNLYHILFYQAIQIFRFYLIWW